jgi:hypothetical protein
MADSWGMCVHPSFEHSCWLSQSTWLPLFVVLVRTFVARFICMKLMFVLVIPKCIFDCSIMISMMQGNPSLYGYFFILDWFVTSCRSFTLNSNILWLMDDTKYHKCWKVGPVFHLPWNLNGPFQKTSISPPQRKLEVNPHPLQMLLIQLLLSETNFCYPSPLDGRNVLHGGSVDFFWNNLVRRRLWNKVRIVLP